MDASRRRLHRYKKGQAVGPRADHTRQLLLDALSKLLATKRPWELRASDVAAAAGTSQSNFYTYFAGIEDAILARAQQIGAEFPDIAALVRADWSEGRGEACARAIVEALIGYWERHRPVLRIVQAYNADDDQDFHIAYVTPMLPMLKAFAAKVAAHQERGDIARSVNPRLVALALTGMLEMLGSSYQLMLKGGYSHAAMVEEYGRIILHTLTGTRNG